MSVPFDAPSRRQRGNATVAVGGPGEVIFMFCTEPWMQRGVCAGMDYEMFFPERGQSVIPAKTVCAGCPVRAVCLDYAISINERHGIWGGNSEKERRVLRRQRGATRPGRRRRVGPLIHRHLTTRAEEASND
jgi:WhiB family redox-sensing transcriptional regulator